MHPMSALYRPDPAILELGEDFYDPVEPADFPKALLRWRDQRAAGEVGLGALSEADWTRHFARFVPLEGNLPQPLALRYHGHQFRSYNHQLGDGRGFLFAQLRDAGGRLLDLGTKGSGQTPWSRSGDGRLTLKGGVREVLAARMLQAQGVPTCRILSLIETGEQLARNDEPSPTRSAAMVRLQHSHIRFGTFQRLAFLQQPENLEKLVDHVCAHYHPACLAGESVAARAVAMLGEIAKATAWLVAGWMSAGFVHGVLNTDNMNVTGESFDYGPWRFLPHADANFTAAYFDHSGLYAYGRQAEAGLWNLKQLAGALSLIADVEALADVIRIYPSTFAHAQRTLLCRRLGVVSRGPEADKAMLDAMFAFMADSGVNWDGFFHDWLCGAASQARALAGPRAGLYSGSRFELWSGLLSAYQPERPARLDHAVLARPEPVSLVIDHVERVWAAIDQNDDWTLFEQTINEIGQLEAALDYLPPAGR
jgi:serine/tyrosine/threonine adenylyltransferase